MKADKHASTAENHALRADDIVSAYGQWYVTEPRDLPVLVARAQVEATLAVASELAALREALTALTTDGGER